MSEWQGDDRRQKVSLSDEQVKEIVALVTEKVLEQVYLNVGKEVLTKLFWVVGAAAVGVYAWLKSKGLVN